MGTRQKSVICILLSIFVILRTVFGFECFIRDFQNYTDSIKGCDDGKTLTFELSARWSRPVPKELINQTKNIHSIDVSNQSLQAIDNKGFCDWPHLTFINAERNNLSSLTAGLLGNCHILLTLSLAWNQISEMYDDAFHGLTLLTELDLSNNNITSLSGDIFKPLTFLKTLRLNNNNIQVIDTEHFRNNKKLETLQLSYNHVCCIERGAFWKLKKLTALDISNNPELNSLDLTEMDRLKDVYVDNASLMQLTVPHYVEKISADNNNITRLTIEQNGNLEELFLSNNSFRNINELSPAQELTSLDISNNNITEIDFAHLMSTKIQRIVLLENPITNFNIQALTNLNYIKYIEITTSNLDNKTLTDLVRETNRLKIALQDPARQQELKTIITMSPVTPEATATSTAKPAPALTLAPTPVQKPTSVTTFATTKSKDGISNDLFKRIQNIESTLKTLIKTKSNQSSSPDEHSKIVQDMANLRVLVICAIVAFSIFVSFQLAIFVTSNYKRWTIPMPNIFSIRHNGLATNRRGHILNNSTDSIMEEVL